MSLDKILSISGKPGLYLLKAKTRSGFVAEALSDGKKLSVNVQHNVSMLSEIAIYTYTEEIPLREVFLKIQAKEDGKESIDPKASKNKLGDYFREILPEYDEDRVYKSDIKKIFQWYNILVNAEITDFSKPEEEAEEENEKNTKVETDNE